MNRLEAEREAARRNRASAGASSAHWFARADSAGDWSLVRVSGLPGMPIDPLVATTTARPRPSHADDPRPIWDILAGPG